MAGKLFVGQSYNVKANVTYVGLNLSTPVSYTNVVASNVLLDPDTKNLYLRDAADNQVLMSEDLAFVLSKADTDLLSVSEQAYILTAKDFSEAVTVSDDFSKVVDYRRTFTDAFTLDDRAQVDSFAVDTGLNKGNVFSFSDQQAFSIDKSFVDDYSVSDDLFAVTTLKAVTDGVAISEVKTFDVAKNNADALLISEAIASDIDKPVSDGLSVTEAYSSSYGLNQADAVAIAEESTLDLSLGKADAIAVSEATAFDISTAYADVVPLAEAAVLLYDKNESDALSVTEVFSKVVFFERVFTDAFTLDDLAQIDAFAVDTDLSKGNVLGFTDTQAFGYQKPFADAFGLSDAPALSTSKPFDEAIGLADAHAISYATFQADSVSVAENLAFSTDVAAADLIAVSEEKAVSFVTAKSDNFSLLEVASRAVGKNFVESVGISETLTIVKRSTASSVLNAGPLNFAPLNN